MKVFLTGGTGFIGSYVVTELVNKGHEVTILARNPGKIPAFLANPSIKLLKGEIKDREVIKAGLYGKDAVVHLALGEFSTAVGAVENDVLPLAYIMETAALMGIKNLISTSTIATYGNIQKPYAEDQPTRPIAFYGAAKACAEDLVFAVAQVYGVRANFVSPGFTFANAIGEGGTLYHDPRFFYIAKQAREGKDIEVVKHTGTQFIHAEDLAKIYSELVVTTTHNRRVFIGMGNEFVTWEEIANMAAEIGGKSKVIPIDQDLTNVTPSVTKNYPIDLSPIKGAFGFDFPSRAKIREHVKWLIENWQ
ncbi:MAG: NAD(P)-dependent oxidoreductase [Clostridiales bacterium]|jgi:UDP-glucose 4-epimerase|nr:NAD(P)-dependent oxidoreductase [Clostridiales bacterium]